MISKMLCLLLSLFIAAARCTGSTHAKHTRDSTILCGMQYADIDKDGRLSRAEVTLIRYLALGNFRQLKAAGLWVAENVFHKRTPVTVDKIFDDCDYNKDGYITFDDYVMMQDTCLNDAGKIDDTHYYVCEQGEAGIFDDASL